jgi:hypothetical protein
MSSLLQLFQKVYGLLLKLVIGIRFFLKNKKLKKNLKKVLHEI